MKEQISTLVRTAIEENRIVGAVVLVAWDGTLVCEAVEGWFDREAGTPMLVDAIFRLASVTKLYVAVATLILVARGKLRLEDPVSEFLPYFRPRLPDGSKPEITIRHLLTHTAGLGYGFLEADGGPLRGAGVSDGMETTYISLEENLRRLATVPLNFHPGSAWMYSLAFDVPGGVLEKIEGKTLGEVIRSLILEPLHLNDTGFQVADPTRLAPAYANAVPIPRRMKPALEQFRSAGGIAPVLMSPDRALKKNAFPSGGAGMVGSARDTLTLLETLRTGGGSLLPEAWIEEMGANQIGNLPVAGWPGWGHGLGFTVLADPAAAKTPESPGAWRWGGAYGHSWFVDTARKLAVVAFTNTAFEGMSGGGQFPVEIRDAVYRSLE